MRRLVLGWKMLGYQRRRNAPIVNHADDLAICCRDGAEGALAAMRGMMDALKLTVNEAKTHVWEVPAEAFDFLGYTFGLHWANRYRATS